MKRRGGGRIFLIMLVVIGIIVIGGIYFYLTNSPNNTTNTPNGGTTNLVATMTPAPKLKKVIVANITIPAFTQITSNTVSYNNVDVTDIAADEHPATSVSEVIGKFSLSTIVSGSRIDLTDANNNDLLYSSLNKLINTGEENPKKKAMAFSGDELQSVAFLVHPGDYIDVVGSYPFAVNIGAKVIPSPTLGTGGGIDQPNPTPVPTTGSIGNEGLVMSWSTKSIIQNIRVVAVKYILDPSAVTPGSDIAVAQQAQTGGTQGQTQTQQQSQGQAPIVINQDELNQYASMLTGTSIQITRQSWPIKAVVILAVNDQEAELIQYTRLNGAVHLIMRAGNDSAIDATSPTNGNGEDPNVVGGVSEDILIRKFGVRLPVYTFGNVTNKPTPVH